MIARILTFLLCLTAAAMAQSVQQSGSVTPGHAAVWLTNGVIQDAGTAASGKFTSLGTTGQGPTICANSAPISQPYVALCLAANTNSAAILSLQNYGGASAQPLEFNINGTVYNFPYTVGGIVGPGSSTVGDAACWNNSSGSLLKDCGYAPLTNALPSGEIFVGSIGGVATAVAMSGDCTIVASGAITCTKTNGTSFGTFATQNYATPPAIGGGTPAAGSFSSLTDTGITGSTQCVQANSSSALSGTGYPCNSSVANLTALQGSCTSATSCPSGDPVFQNGVWRLTFGNGNGAEPLFYAPSVSACSLNSGAGDNGLQVKSADSKCWIAQFPAFGASITQFGALGDANPSCATGCTDNTAIVQAAVNDLPSNGYRIVAPAGAFCLSTGPVIVPAAAVAGFSTSVVGYSNQSSVFNGCNHDVTLFEWEGTGGGMSDIGLFCRGSQSTDTFSFSKPCLYVHGGGENTFNNLNVEGGLYTILLNNDANSERFYNLFAFGAYGNANILCQSCSDVTIDNSTIDQSWPVEPLTSANISSFSAWASGQAYAANTVVEITSAAENLTYLVQCVNCNGVLSSSGSAPTLKPNGATMNNGSDSLNWQLVAPSQYIGIDCDTSCNEMIVSNTDVAGPYINNFAVTNSLSGTAPTGVMLKNVTTSFNTGSAINLAAGSAVEIDGGSVAGCAISGCSAIEMESGYTSVTNIYGEQIAGTTNGVVDAAGTQLSLSNSVINVNACFLAENSVTKFSVIGIQCPNASGAITIDSGSDEFTIIGNITGATTVNANVTNNGSAHSSVQYNW